MKNRPQIITHIAALLACTLPLLSSCLKEDMSDCPEQIRVYFTYTASPGAAGDEGIDPSGVDRMHLYVFCHKGYFLGEYRDDHIAGFNADYYMDCSDLLPGKYRFVAWGGKDEGCYAASPAFVRGKTTIDEALLTLAHPAQRVDYTPHHLYHAELNTATVTTRKIQRFNMPLLQLTNTINVRTEGLPASGDSYALRITDDNCTYTFDRSLAPCTAGSTFTYAAPFTKDAQNQLNGSLRVLRLEAGRRRPQLVLYNETAAAPLYPVGAQSGDLIGLILSAYPQNDFDQVHTYDILLSFSGSDASLTVTISINGWRVKEQNGELIPD